MSQVFTPPKNVFFLHFDMILSQSTYLFLFYICIFFWIRICYKFNIILYHLILTFSFSLSCFESFQFYRFRINIKLASNCLFLLIFFIWYCLLWELPLVMCSPTSRFYFKSVKTLFFWMIYRKRIIKYIKKGFVIFSLE